MTLHRRRLTFALVAALSAGGVALAQTQPRLETAVFAGGCFWSMEHALEDLPGVVSAVSGYTGGRVEHPTYEQVVTETTGHREAVKVTFDPARISYAKLVDAYFHATDPTDDGGQFCDRGESYRPAIYVSPAQRATAEQVKAQVAAELKGKRVVTPILPAQTFWPAEAYHQQFTKKNPLRYQAYFIGCGRGPALKAVWAGAR